MTLTTWIPELRQAARRLRRAPAFTLASVLTLGLALGALTAVFTVARPLLMSPLPFPEPERLVRVRQTDGTPDFRIGLSNAAYWSWKEANTVFDSMAAATGGALTLTSAGEPELLDAALVTHDFFAVLGVEPSLGRGFLPEEDRPGGRPVVLLSDGLWRGRFAADRDIVGRSIVLDGQAREVIGVLPPGFAHPYRAQIWTPLALEHDPSQTGGYLYVPARLRDGVSLAAAQAALTGWAQRRGEAGEAPPAGAALGAHLTGLQRELLGDLRPALLGLLLAALLVVTIATANVLNLWLARLVSRRQDLAVRAALGAGGASLARTLAAEALWVTALGSALGLLLAQATLPLLLALSPLADGSYGSAIREVVARPRIDRGAIALAVAMAAGLALTLTALAGSRSWRLDPKEALHDGSRGMTGGRGRKNLLRLLVVVEAALALVVLVGGGMAATNLYRLVDADPGYLRHRLLVADISLPEARYPDGAARVRFFARVAERLRQQPDAEAAGVTSTHPLYGGTWLARVSSDGVPAPDPPGTFLVHHRVVLPGTLEALGVKLERGRSIEDRDRAGAPLAVVISRSLADRFWPGQDAVGRRIQRGPVGDPRPPFEVVGVVSEVSETVDRADGEVAGTWYLAYEQLPNLARADASLLVLVRQGDPAAFAETLRRVVAAEDPELALSNVAAMDRIAAQSRVFTRFQAWLSGLLAVLGLSLAAIGVYGVLSCGIAERRLEFGIRSALGSTPGGIARLVVREGMLLVGLGTAVGLGLTWTLLRLLRGEFFGIETVTPAVLAWALLAIVGVGFLSVALPARRGARLATTRTFRDSP